MKSRLLKKLHKSERTSPRQPLGKKPERSVPYPSKKHEVPRPVFNYVSLVVAATYIQSRDGEYAFPQTRDTPSGPTAEDIRWVIGQELLRLFVSGRNPENEKNIDALTTRICYSQNGYSGTASAYHIAPDGTRDRRSDILRARPWIHSRTS